jgi:hypothetical protein
MKKRRGGILRTSILISAQQFIFNSLASPSEPLLLLRRLQPPAERELRAAQAHEVRHHQMIIHRPVINGLNATS